MTSEFCTKAKIDIVSGTSAAEAKPDNEKTRENWLEWPGAEISVAKSYSGVVVIVAIFNPHPLTPGVLAERE